MANDASIVTAQPADSADDADWMRSLARQLQFSSTGQRAGLRRMAPGKSFAADATVMAFLTRAKVSDHKQRLDIDRWRLVAHFAAMLVGTGEPGHKLPFVQAKNRKLGTLLNSVKYSEIRLSRLLSVRDDALHDQVRRVARFLAQKGEQQVNLWTLYHLLSGDERKAEAARIEIAHDYYAAEARSKTGASNDD